MGEFPSGQRGQTVNLLLSASVVRIHPLPPKRYDCVDTNTVVHFLCPKTKQLYNPPPTFISYLEDAPLELPEWSDKLWLVVCEKGTIHKDGTIAFEFKEGSVIRV